MKHLVSIIHSKFNRFFYHTVEHLRPKHTYEFRVSAENPYGMSSPSDTTSPIIMKDSSGRKKHEYEGELIRFIFCRCSWRIIFL